MRFMLRNFSILIIITTQITGCAVGVAGAAGGSILVSQDRRTAGTFVDDQAITLKANLALAKDKELWKKSRISTLTYNNTLLLVGQTPESHYKSRLETLLDQIPEIEQIHNQVVINEPISFAQKSKDTWITTQIKGKLLASKTVGLSKIKVTTEDNVVYLMGILTEEEGQAAVDIASTIKDVKEVVKIFEHYQS